MKCRYIENSLIGYIENTLPEQTLAEINLHLETCFACKKLVLQVKNTYSVLDNDKVIGNNLMDGIHIKLLRPHTNVVEFIPRHRIAYRIAASVIVIIGVGLGVLLGGKYSSSRMSNTQTIANQYGLPEYYNNESNSMDGESDLAVLYPNE